MGDDVTTITRRQLLTRASMAAGVVLLPGALAACNRGASESGGSPAGTLSPTAGVTTRSAPTEAATGGLLQQLQEQGYVRAAFNNEPPSNFINEEGELTGEAVEIARMVLGELGIEQMDGVLTEFSSIIPSLQAERVAMSGVAFFITPDRCDQVYFSDPIRCLQQALLMPADSSIDVRSYTDIADNPDISVGVVSGGAEHQYAMGSGIPDDRIIVLSDTQSRVDALKSGRVDVAGGPASSLSTNVAQNPDLRTSEPFTPIIDGEEQLGCSGFAFADKEFRDTFNEKLRELIDSEALGPIQDEYGVLVSDRMDGYARSADELCQGSAPG